MSCAGLKQTILVGSQERESGAIPIHSGVPQGSVIGPLLFHLFVKDLPNDLETLTLLFADDVKMVVTEYELSQFSYCCMGLVEEMGPTDQSHNRARSSPGSGIHIPVSKLLKDLGFQTDNMFSPSAQCTEAANKARRLIFMIKHSFQYLWKLDFTPLYGAIVRPRLEYGMSAYSPNLVADINHIERILKISYTVSNWHAAPPLRRETASTGPSFLAAVTVLIAK